jgi:ABC-type lipoprotein release transport system permease subunit
VDALDVPSFLGAAATLTLVAVTATITPTRRVLRLDPVEALRSE